MTFEQFINIIIHYTIILFMYRHKSGEPDCLIAQELYVLYNGYTRYNSEQQISEKVLYYFHREIITLYNFRSALCSLNVVYDLRCLEFVYGIFVVSLCMFTVSKPCVMSRATEIIRARGDLIT